MVTYQKAQERKDEPIISKGKFKEYLKETSYTSNVRKYLTTKQEASAIGLSINQLDELAKNYAIDVKKESKSKKTSGSKAARKRTAATGKKAPTKSLAQLKKELKSDK